MAKYLCIVTLNNAVRATSKVVPVLLAADNIVAASDRAGHLALRTVWEQPGWAIKCHTSVPTDFGASKLGPLLGSEIVEEPAEYLRT